MCSCWRRRQRRMMDSGGREDRTCAVVSLGVMAGWAPRPLAHAFARRMGAVASPHKRRQHCRIDQDRGDRGQARAEEEGRGRWRGQA